MLLLSQRKARDATVNLDTYRNLQWHRAVLVAIARLSCFVLQCLCHALPLFMHVVQVDMKLRRCSQLAVLIAAVCFTLTTVIWRKTTYKTSTLAPAGTILKGN